MNKTEATQSIAKECKFTHVSAAKFLDTLIAVITKVVKKGEKVTVPGFMTISKGKRSARNGRNPQTGKPIKIPAKNYVKLKAGKSLTDAVN